MENTLFRGAVGALLTLLLIIAFQGYLVRIARKRAAASGGNIREVQFMDLIITSDDESYSLSRLQMYLWTVAVVTGFAAVWAAGFSIPEIPQNLYLLMGVNLAASVAATAITTSKNVPQTNLLQAQNQQQSKKPDFFNDIFFESTGSLDLPRTQMFTWTVISLVSFVIMLANTLPGTPKMPNIPTGLVVLMGMSHGAYLGTKAAS